jgi:hypothetical protein
MPRRTPYTIREFHKLGKRVLKEDAKCPKRGKGVRHWGVVKSIQEDEEVSRDLIEKARRFATVFSDDDVTELCALRGPSGKLGHWHAIHLLTVRRKRDRLSLARRAAKEGWSVARLRAEVRQRSSKTSSGGRRPTKPDNVDVALVDIERLANKYIIWCKSMKTGTADVVRLANLPKSVREQLEELEPPIIRLRDLAVKQLAKGRERRSKKSETQSRTKAGTEKKRTSRSPSKGRKPAKRKR